VKQLAIKADQKNPATGRKMLKRLSTTLLFLITTAVIEYLIVLFAMSLGLQDTSIVQWSFQFPGTSSALTLTLNPLFHLVPICVIVTLAFSWTYLTKKVATRKQEMHRGKVETFSRQKSEKRGIVSRIRRAGSNFSRGIRSRLSVLNRFSQRVRLGRPTVRSALMVILFFCMFTLLFILLAYPKLIYHGMSSLYRANPALLNFVNSVNNWVKGAGEALGPIGGIGKAITDGLIAASPGVRDLGVGLGEIIKPMASLDNAGKFLVFQNAAAWISAIVVLIFGERVAKGYKYKK
jgi:hypothetical protein